MKKHSKIFLLCVLMVCSFLIVFPQDKSLSEQEFTSLRNAAFEKLKNRNYRVVMTSESYRSINDSAPYYFISEITEYISPDRRHYISERKNAQNISREETISIGQKKYIRLNNEDWKEVSLVGNNNGSGTGSGIVGAVINNGMTIKYKYKGKEFIKNQKADLHEVTTTRKYDTPNFRSTTVMIERFWFDKDGVFLKTEIVSKINDKINSHTVREYEYDPNIKIEAPVLKAENKN